MSGEIPLRTATCERGFERVVPMPAGCDEQSLLVLVRPVPSEGDPFFPECEDCKRDQQDILLMPNDSGVCHIVKVCTIRFKEMEDSDGEH